MASEDGVCLAQMLEQHRDDIRAALTAYRMRRLMRTARVQLMSRAIGEHIYHPSGVHAALRNTLMKAKSDDDWYDTLDWLYGDPQ